ncbi:unnamed protein product, partial [Musa acuminata subsp. burmannicoides]
MLAWIVEVVEQGRGILPFAVDGGLTEPEDAMFPGSAVHQVAATRHHPHPYPARHNTSPPMRPTHVIHNKASISSLHWSSSL